MKTLVLLLAVFLSAALVVHAQDENMHAPDGGAFTRFQSISIPPLSGAPFSATVTTKWTRSFADGNVEVLHNVRAVARDSAGRVFQERALFVPDQAQEPAQPREIDISDPLTHRQLRCVPAIRLCTVFPYYASAAVAPLRPAGALPGNRGYLNRISLGNNTVSGLDAVGTRETTTYNPGVFGNRTSMSVVREIWYSPQLDLNLSVHRLDPRFGAQDFVVSDISLSGPDPSLFQMPQGYRLAGPVQANAALPPQVQSR